MRYTTHLILSATLSVGTLCVFGCDSKDDKGTVTPSDAAAQVHSDAAKDKMSNAGDAMKNTGSSIKDAAKETGGAISESAKSMKDKVDASASTAPSAHVDVTLPPPATAP